MNSLLQKLKNNKLLLAAAVALLGALFGLLSPEVRKVVFDAVGVAPVASDVAPVDSGAAAVDSQ